MRIASLLPSATEIVCSLGLREQLVAVSHECDHPADVKGLPVVTAPNMDPSGSSAEIDRQVRSLVTSGLSIYRIDEERLRALRPDVIVTQDTCRVCAVSLDEVREVTRRLIGTPVEVVSLSPLALDDVLSSIVRVGAATGAAARAGELVASLRARLEALRQATQPLPRPRLVMLEWLDPPMVAGHWTPELLRLAGGEPALAHHAEPTRATSWGAVAAVDPDFLLVAPCGFRLDQTRREIPRLRAVAEFTGLRAVREGRVALVDGNAYFNRPGPRLVESAQIAAVAMHAQRVAIDIPAGAMVRWSDLTGA